jgi:hypothetical protein
MLLKQGFKIFVQTPTGKNIEVIVSPFSTGMDIKASIN